MKLRLLPAALLLAALASCAGTPAAPPEDQPGRVQHVVLMWLKQPGDEGACAKLISAARSIRSIPGVLAIRAGRALPSERAVVDDSFDVALVMTFADAAALAAYDVHPDHVRVVQELLPELVARIVVYDLVE